MTRECTRMFDFGILAIVDAWFMDAHHTHGQNNQYLDNRHLLGYEVVPRPCHDNL